MQFPLPCLLKKAPYHEVLFVHQRTLRQIEEYKNLSIPQSTEKRRHLTNHVRCHKASISPKFQKCNSGVSPKRDTSRFPTKRLKKLTCAQKLTTMSSHSKTYFALSQMQTVLPDLIFSKLTNIDSITFKTLIAVGQNLARIAQLASP